MLRRVFNPRSTAEPASQTFKQEDEKSLEAIASIESGHARITLRRRINKITQRLGSVELPQDDDAEVQLFDWCDTAVQERDTISQQNQQLRKSCDEAQATVKLLQEKIEELVKVQAEKEEELISKFVVLLNEKKLKIRNQQRLFNAANLDSGKLKALQKSIEPESGSHQGDTITKGLRGKRAAEDSDASESSDAFEAMGVDGAKSRESTPSGTEGADNTEAEAETEAEIDVGIAGSNQETGSIRARWGTPAAKNKELTPPPPVRDLPFKRRQAQGKTSKDTDKTRNAETDTAMDADISGEPVSEDRSPGDGPSQSNRQAHAQNETEDQDEQMIASAEKEDEEATASEGDDDDDEL